jgi:hypothetical protein
MLGRLCFRKASLIWENGFVPMTVRRQRAGLWSRARPKDHGGLRLRVRPSSLPFKLELGISHLWRLLIFPGWPRRSRFGCAENPPVTFICELKKQVRNGRILLGES